MYDLHFSTFDVSGLNWIYRFGAHVGFTDGNNNRFNECENITLFRVDLLSGIEYNFENVPISIGFDWKPYCYIIGDTQFIPHNAAISVRYLFRKS